MTQIHLVAAMIACHASAACSTAPKSAEGKADIPREADTTIARSQERDSKLADAVRTSAGYAVFPKIGKAALGVGGVYGKGTLYEHGTMVGYCNMSQATVDLRLGGQTYTGILGFEDAAALEMFKAGEFAFDAQASTAALEEDSEPMPSMPRASKSSR